MEGIGIFDYRCCCSSTWSSLDFKRASNREVANPIASTKWALRCDHSLNWLKMLSTCRVKFRMLAMAIISFDTSTFAVSTSASCNQFTSSGRMHPRKGASWICCGCCRGGGELYAGHLRTEATAEPCTRHC